MRSTAKKTRDRHDQEIHSHVLINVSKYQPYYSSDEEMSHQVTAVERHVNALHQQEQTCFPDHVYA